jgi:hypothetical protein
MLAAIVQSKGGAMMSFDWRTDDILRMPANAEVEDWATERNSGECFSLKVDGDVRAVLSFVPAPPWLPKFLKFLPEKAFPTLTVQDWIAVLDVAPAPFFATLNVLLQGGVILQPNRRSARSYRMSA